MKEMNQTLATLPTKDRPPENSKSLKAWPTRPGRINSATGTPTSACFKTATICSTEERFLFTANLPSFAG
jgi:hypothetical protein